MFSRGNTILNFIQMKQKIMVVLLLALFLTTQIVARNHKVLAATAGSVVINEIAWAGTPDNTNDEWIELYNTTNQPISLDGWTINDDNGASIYTLSGSINAHGYYLIEDSENTVMNQPANTIINLSLANTGDSLIVKDNNNQTIDAVNTSGGAWFAGNATSKATMERIDPLISGDIATNWATNITPSGATGSNGSVIPGTPKAINSVSTVNNSSGTIMLEIEAGALPNEMIVKAKTENIEDLFSYGLEIEYDPSIFTFISSTKGTFLSENSNKETSFQWGLENGNQGKLLIAEAITEEGQVGTSGNGELFQMKFGMLQNSTTSITFGNTTFAANKNGDIGVIFEDATFEPQIAVEPISNLNITEGLDRYSLQLEWTSPLNSANSYKIYRQSSLGTWELLEEIDGSLNQFTDNDLIDNGGKIIPFIEYHYRIISVKNGIESTPVEIMGKETRGLKGDNNRSDRVDGRDLENLAHHFGETSASETFALLIDTTYDAQIDGSDLIDLGLNFAKTYP